MLLVIDVGNTNIVLGVYQGYSLICDFRLNTRKNKTISAIIKLVDEKAGKLVEKIDKNENLKKIIESDSNVKIQKDAAVDLKGKLPDDNKIKEGLKHTDINNIVIDKENSTVFLKFPILLFPKEKQR